MELDTLWGQYGNLMREVFYGWLSEDGIISV